MLWTNILVFILYHYFPCWKIIDTTIILNQTNYAIKDCSCFRCVLFYRGSIFVISHRYHGVLGVNFLYVFCQKFFLSYIRRDLLECWCVLDVNIMRETIIFYLTKLVFSFSTIWLTELYIFTSITIEQC